MSRRRSCRLLVLTLALSHSTLVRGEPTTCLDQTPTERVIANLEKLVADKPNDASVHFILARAHSIAYALNSPVIRDCDTGAPRSNVLYDNAGNVPPALTAPPSYRQGPQAQRHLQAAIEGYARAVNLAPADAFVRLGYGWALQQAGRPGEAIAQYRQAISVAWPRDEELNTRPRVIRPRWLRSADLDMDHA